MVCKLASIRLASGFERFGVCFGNGLANDLQACLDVGRKQFETALACLGRRGQQMVWNGLRLALKHLWQMTCSSLYGGFANSLQQFVQLAMIHVDLCMPASCLEDRHGPIQAFEGLGEP
jgi:hypothetical protein